MLLQVKFAKITHEQRHPTDQYNEYLKEIAGILGIEKRAPSHLARHTFATTVTYANGVSIEAISKMLGHTKLSTTQIYARIVDQTISREMDKLSDGDWNITHFRGSIDVMHRYQISSTTAITRSKTALIKNDILDNKAGEVSFQDPIYAYWLKTEYFGG